MAYVIAEPCIDNSDQSCVAGLPGRLHHRRPVGRPQVLHRPRRLHRLRLVRDRLPEPGDLPRRPAAAAHGPSSPGSTRPGIATRRRPASRRRGAARRPDDGRHGRRDARLRADRLRRRPGRPLEAERDARRPDRPDPDDRPVRGPAGRRGRPVRAGPVLRPRPGRRRPPAPAALLDGVRAGRPRRARVPRSASCPAARSRRGCGRLRVGARLRIGRAKGLFTLRPGDPRTHLFVATGTGLAPFLSMLETLVRDDPAGALGSGPPAPPPAPPAGDRRPRRLAPRTSWPTATGSSGLAAGRDDVRYVPVVSRPEDPANAGWAGLTGRVDAQLGRALRRACARPGGERRLPVRQPGDDRRRRADPRRARLRPRCDRQRAVLADGLRPPRRRRSVSR